MLCYIEPLDEGPQSYHGFGINQTNEEGHE